MLRRNQKTIGEMDRKVLENRGKLVHASRCHTFHKVCIWEQTWNDTGPILLGAFHLYSAGLVSIGCEDFLRFRSQLWFSIYLFIYFWLSLPVLMSSTISGHCFCNARIAPTTVAASTNTSNFSFPIKRWPIKKQNKQLSPSEQLLPNHF